MSPRTLSAATSGKGRLQARRQTGEEGRSWVVELPEEGWQDDDKDHIDSLARQLTPWWWPNPYQRGEVHYVMTAWALRKWPQFTSAA